MFGIEMASRGAWGRARMRRRCCCLGVVASALYVLHARHHQRPMLDFRMLRIPTFRYP